MLFAGAKAKRSLSPSEAASPSALGDSDESLDVIPGALPPGARVPTPPDESDNGDHDSEDFIVEDSGDNVDLPLEFSMKSHSDIAHHFKSKLLTRSLVDVRLCGARQSSVSSLCTLQQLSPQSGQSSLRKA